MLQAARQHASIRLTCRFACAVVAESRHNFSVSSADGLSPIVCIILLFSTYTCRLLGQHTLVFEVFSGCVVVGAIRDFLWLLHLAVRSERVHAALGKVLRVLVMVAEG